jgi:hypothetical protein
MNKITLLVATLSAALSTSAFAGTSTCCTAASQTANKPVPVKVVSPTHLPRSYENATVEVALTIDAQGVPHDVRPVGKIDRRVEQSLVTAVSQWRFTPNVVNGQPVSTRVLLPLQLVDGA